MAETICHISFNHSPFDDRIYWKELMALKKAGYSVIHIAVSTEDADFLSKEGIRIISVKRKVKYKNPYINRLLQFLSRKGTTVESIFFKAVSVNADIYHYHDLQINALSKKLKNLPQKPIVVYDTHEAYHLLLKQKESKSLLDKAFNSLVTVIISRWELKMVAHCDFIITTDKYTYDYFENKLPQIQKKIIHNYSFFEAKLAHQKQKQFDFIYSGQISRSRGIIELIYGLKICKANRPDVSLLIIGDFEFAGFKNEISALVEKLDLTNNITLHGAVPFEQINYYYEVSRVGICLLHNTAKYTTAIPIKLFEYMAFGLPIVCSDHGISAQIVKEADCGILVDYTNKKLIGKALIDLLRDEESYKKFSQNGIKAVNEKYNWTKEKKLFLQLYQDLLHNKHSSFKTLDITN